MVSFYQGLAENPRSSTEVHAEFEEASSKKRKCEELHAEEFFKDQLNLDKRKSILDVEPHLKTPIFPSDKWSQHFSIQSGQIKLCNTRGNRTITEDHNNMSLDLELNLTCESQRKKEDKFFDINYEKQFNSGSSGSYNLREHADLFTETTKYCKKDSSSDGSNCSPSWLSSSSSEGEYKEMVATVCMRCHMLVMLCKSSPTCPNCKFMHPPDQSTSQFLKRRCRASLFC